MDARAPDRTDTNNGLRGSPNPDFINRSTCVIPFRVCAHMPAGYRFLVLKYSRQASVVMVKPGGTEILRLVISARPAPFPPSNAFMAPVPCALPSPKEYTYFLLRMHEFSPLTGATIRFRRLTPEMTMVSQRSDFPQKFLHDSCLRRCVSYQVSKTRLVRMPR